MVPKGDFQKSSLEVDWVRLSPSKESQTQVTVLPGGCRWLLHALLSQHLSPRQVNILGSRIPKPFPRQCWKMSHEHETLAARGNKHKEKPLQTNPRAPHSQ